MLCRCLPSARRFAVPLLVLAVAGAARAQDAGDAFRQGCASCHTIGGGRLTGPDLKGVLARKDRAWLEAFIADPKGVVDSGDPYAAGLVKEARGVVMPAVAGLTKDTISALLDLIEAESAKEKSDFAGIQISDQPFTAKEIRAGRDLFTGRKPLKNGGPACIGCHTVNGLRGLGGGRLGPDLTKVFERIPGRKAMVGWLQAPATPTMQGVFKARALDSAEIVPLVAYFERAARRSGPADSVPLLTFFLLGLAGAVSLLVTFDSLWRRRFRSVRRALISSARSESRRDILPGGKR